MIGKQGEKKKEWKEDNIEMKTQSKRVRNEKTALARTNSVAIQLTTYKLLKKKGTWKISSNAGIPRIAIKSS